GARRERIVAVLGPSIGPDNYEVGPEFVTRFVETDAGNHRYFSPSKTTAHHLGVRPRRQRRRLLRRAGCRRHALPHPRRFLRSGRARPAGQCRGLPADGIRLRQRR
ncbi:hypothetical protein EN831_33975, partial [Mesorhizobium sp. M1C.F.Ca.ET.188.01.1.1]